MGQAEIGSEITSILNSTTAFFGVIVAGIFLADEALTLRKLIGALFDVIKVAVIIGFDVLSDFDLRNLAQVAIMGAALSYTLAGVWAKRFLSGYPPLINAFGMSLASTFLIAPTVILFQSIGHDALSGFGLIVVGLLVTDGRILTLFKSKQ